MKRTLFQGLPLLALLTGFSTIGLAETEVTYNVTWEEARHRLHFTTALGGSDAPSSIFAGDPKVKEDIGSLTGKVLELKPTSPTNSNFSYEQIYFDLYRNAEVYTIEFDISIAALPTDAYVTIFLDTELGAGFQDSFRSDGILWMQGPRSYSLNTTYHFKYVYDRGAKVLTTYLDGVLLGTSATTNRPFTDLRDLRINVSDSSHGAQVGLDNVEITSLNPESAAIPATPQNLRVLDNSSPDGIELVWSEAENASSYSVYRSVGSSFGHTLFADDILENRFVDEAADEGVYYNYYVIARNSYADSGLSDEVGGRLNDRITGPPEPPEGVMTTPMVNDPDAFIAVSWQASDRTVIYELYRASNPDFTDEVLLGSTNETAFIDGPILDHETYYYRLAAENGYGRSPRSDWAFGRIPRDAERLEDPDDPVPGRDPVDAAITEATLGSYEGLLNDVDNPSSIVGKLYRFKIRPATTRRPATYSGAMRIGKKRYSIRGEISPEGLATIFHRHFTGAIQIQTDDNGKSVFSGQIVFPETSLRVGIRAHHAVDRDAAGRDTKRQTLFFPANPDILDPMPDGDGVASSSSRRGRVRTKCILGDAQKTSFSALQLDGVRHVFYRPIYSGTARGVVTGEYYTVTGDPLTDVAGFIYWEKGANLRSRSIRYPNGFSDTLKIVGSNYDRDFRGDIPGEPDVVNFLAIMEGGDLPQTAIDFFLYSNERNYLRDLDRKFSGRISPSTGLFSAKIRVPHERKRRTIYGALNQKQQIITGLYRGNRECGFFSVAPEAITPPTE